MEQEKINFIIRGFQVKFLNIIEYSIKMRTPFLNEVLSMLKQCSEFKLQDLIPDLKLYIEVINTQS